MILVECYYVASSGEVYACVCVCVRSNMHSAFNEGLIKYYNSRNHSELYFYNFQKYLRTILRLIICIFSSLSYNFLRAVAISYTFNSHSTCVQILYG